MSAIQVKIKATNFNLTPDIETYVATKLSHVEKYISPRPDTEAIAYVEIEKMTGEHHKQGKIFRSEINLHYKGHSYRSESTEEDIFAAIDESCQEMGYEMRRGKERHIDLVRRGGNALKKLLRFGRDE